MKIKELTSKIFTFETFKKIFCTYDFKNDIIEGENGTKYSSQFFFVDEGGYICKISDGKSVGVLAKGYT